MKLETETDRQEADSLQADGWAALSDVKRHLERTGHEARGGSYRRHAMESKLERAAADGLRALAELERALERIAGEAQPNSVFNELKSDKTQD